MSAAEDMPEAHGTCHECPIARREFLRAGSALAALAFGAIAMPEQAAALPVRFAPARARHGKAVHYAIPAADGATVDRENDVIIARVAGAIYALDLTCPHQHTAIRWNARETRFECPRHHSKYSPAGLFLEGRATRSLDRFPIRREGNEVVVDVEMPYEEHHDRAQWEAAVVELQAGA
jgi:nitrite reductase/ring-hydroxylating ferredoxin subunit